MKSLRPIICRLVAFMAIWQIASTQPTRAANAPPLVRAVALSGQAAPGTSSGVVYRDFNQFYFSLNDAGQVAFLGYISGPDVGGFNEGIWSEGFGSLALVAREGDHPPDTTEFMRYDSLAFTVLNNPGQVAYAASVQEGFLMSGQGVWSQRLGLLSLVAGTGNQAPGAGPGVNFAGFSGLVLNDSGRTAFKADLGGDGVDLFNDEGIWSEGPGPLTLIGRQGSQATGMPAGMKYDVFGFPVINDNGRVAFYAHVDGNGGLGQGVWSERAGGLALVARSGTDAPGISNGANFAGFSDPAFNTFDHTAFWAYLAGPGQAEPYDDGIWSEGANGLELVAHRGSQAPGAPTGVNFGSGQIVTFDRPVLSDSGKLAFRGFTSGPGVDESNGEGIWTGTAGDLTLLARTGGHAPGTPAGVTFETFFPWNGALQMNALGQCVFTALLKEGDFSAGTGIWATDVAGTLRKIASTGDSLEIAPGNMRTIQALSFVHDGSGGSDGRSKGINNRGQIAFWAKFNGGDEGIFVSNVVAVPEPAGLALFALGAVAFAVRRVRRTKARFYLCGGLSIAISISVQVAHADIFEWEYINTTNPNLGKQPSTTLAPGGAGANVVQGANLANRDLTKAYLIGANLSALPWGGGEFGDDFFPSNLNGVNLNQADLTDANLAMAWLHGATLSGAEVGGATFSHSPYYGYGSGLTPAQLYSTASYADHDLTGINLEANSLAGVNLASQNLTRANLSGATLTGSNLHQSNLTDSNLYAVDLTNANLSQANLANANLALAKLTGANFSGAEVRGASFLNSVPHNSFLSAAQLYSTASYQAHDLTAISLHGDYPGIMLAGQNLTDASFGVGADLHSANFSNANLTHVHFVGTNLASADFSGANLTDASIGDMISSANFSNAVIRGATVWGLSKAQIYSTASYQTGDLREIYFYSSQTNWNFAGKNLTGAEFQSAVDMSNSSFAGADLTDASLSYVSFQNANFSNADLTGADLSYSKLTGANFTGADVRGARLSREFTYPGSGISVGQLASTASYQAHDLTGIRLRGNVLTNANLANQNLTDADFVGASLDGANLTNAEVRGAQFHLHPSGQAGGLTAAQLESTASYQAHDLSGIGLGGNNLAGANLVGQNLTNADFESALYGANLNGADLSYANLTNARLGNSTLTGATLVGATLTDLDLHLTELSTANLSGADLSRSHFGGYVIVVPGGDEGGGGYYNFPGTNLTGANLSGANLTNANFAGTLDFFGSPFPGANLTNANLSGADMRGANLQDATLTGAITTNLIHENGHIAGLDLTTGKSLVVRDYDLPIGADIPIVVDQGLTMDGSGSLQLSFDSDAWGSTISFAPGIPVALGGKLDLAFAATVDSGAQLGRTIDLFDWTGVTPTGVFNVVSPYGWDVSKLYTTGEVTLTSAAGHFLGDFNDDGVIDADDLTSWSAGFGIDSSAMRGQGDADGDLDVDGADFLAWQRRLGFGPAAALSANPIPEPPTTMLVIMALVCIFWISGRACQETRHRASQLTIKLLNRSVRDWRHVT